MAQALKVELEFFFQFVTGVIGTHRDSHKGILPWETVVVACLQSINFCRNGASGNCAIGAGNLALKQGRKYLSEAGLTLISPDC
jgi:hypothetical protein